MAERVKVLRVIARLNVGGPALHVAYLTAGLAERGYDTTLVAGTLGRGEESMAVRRGREGRHDRGDRGAPPQRSRRSATCAPSSASHELIRRERPTILHTHTAKAGAVGRVAALLAGRARPPIVVHTFHGHVLRGYFSRRRDVRLPHARALLARMTTKLIAVSPEVRDDLVRLGVAPASKFTVVRLGIELEQRVDSRANGRAETRRVLGLADDPFVVGWVGRMTAVKRTDVVVRTLRALVDRGVDARLLLVGDGPDRDGLERIAHDLGVVKRCLFLGYQEDVARFYNAIDALLLPSVNEGTPVSVIESLAAQRPAVATRVGGTPDVIRDGVDGFLVDSGRRRTRLPSGSRSSRATRPARAAMGEAGTRARARALCRRAARRRRRPSVPRAARRARAS